MSHQQSNNSSSNEEEGLIAHILRVCKNSCTKCFGVVQTTDEYAKIKYKEYQMENRKKQFGIEYFALVSNPNATEAEKQACIDAVLNDTATVTKEIEALRQEIERVKQSTQDKIVAKPGTAAAAAAASTTTGTSTPAAAAVEAPTTPAPVATTPEVSTGVEVTATATPMVEEDPTMSEVPLTTTTDGK
jgi:hypothetical protein